MTDPPDPAQPRPDSDTGRRHRPTKLYSDGFAAVQVGPPDADTETTVVTALPAAPRGRPVSETIIELAQDRAAVALPEVPADAVLQEPVVTPAAEAQTPAEPQPAVRIRLDKPVPRNAPTKMDLPAVQTQTAVGPVPQAPKTTLRGWQIAAALLLAAVFGATVVWVIAPRPVIQAQRPVDSKQQTASSKQQTASSNQQTASSNQPQLPQAAASDQQPTRTAQPLPPPPAPCAGFDHVVAGTAADALAPWLAMRTAPDNTAPLLAELADGTRLQVVASQGRWRRVRMCDRAGTGWVHARWVQPLAAQNGGEPK